METVTAILKDEFCETDFNKHDVKASVSEDSEGSALGICNSVGQDPIMWAVRCGHVELFQLLISKSGGISDRDTYSVSTVEQCFVGGHASKLSQFCEAGGIGHSIKGLKGALVTLITQDLVDAQKVLCLCAISGDSILLEQECLDALSVEFFRMPSALKCA